MIDMEITVYVKLVAKKTDLYTLYVFQDMIDEEKFIMCTKPPNFDRPPIQIGDVGYLTYDNVEAGTDYYNNSENNYKKYKYNNKYFINFIKENNKLELIL